MRILICGINYAPELVGIGKFTSEMAEWLVEQGHQIRVVTAPPYYPAWKVFSGHRGWSYSHQVRRGVSIYRCPIWVTRHPTGLQRLIHLASFAISSFPVMLMQLFWRPNIVLVIEPALFSLPSALLVAKLNKAVSWLHIHDFEIDAGFTLGLMPNISWLRRGILKGERWLMQQCQLVTTISEKMLDRLYTKQVEPTKAFLFPNWVDTNQIYPLSQANSLRGKLHFTDSNVIVLYAGTMGSKQGLELLIQAADCLQTTPALQFVLAGDGPQRRQLEQMVTAQQLQNVHFLPIFPTEEFNQLLNLADIHVLVQKQSMTDLVMPSKLSGMLASGKPIIATADPDSEIAQVISAAKCGILVQPEKLAPLVQAIQIMVKQPHQRLIWGQNGRHYAEQRLSQTVILNHMLSRLLQKGTPQKDLVPLGRSRN
jgi:colanic acid biosynthesis glycosyl transferase WcaI